MRALTFTELSRDDFEAFSERAAHGNFQQTVMAADLRKRNRGILQPSLAPG